MQLNTGQKLKFSIKDFFGKCDQIRNFLRLWLYSLKESLIEKFIFVQLKMVYQKVLKEKLLIPWLQVSGLSGGTGGRKTEIYPKWNSYQ